MNFNSGPPAGWEREIPRYRATREIHPSPNRRHRLELPFAAMGSSDVWQFGTQIVEANEIVETREWPHASFRPVNYSAKKILEFFLNASKSRLQRSPFRNGQLVLDDGLGGTLEPNVKLNSGVSAA